MNEPFTYHTSQPELFAAAARFISAEETRHYLRGVKVEPVASGGVRLIATDGQRMLVAYDATGIANREAIITPPKIKMASTWFKSKGAVFRDGLAYLFKHFEADAELAAKPGAELVAFATSTEAATEVLNAEYPQWRNIAKWPSTDKPSSDAWTINWAYVRDAQEVKGLLTDTKNPQMPFRLVGEGEVHAIRLTDACAVWITPMRNQAGDEAFRAPHWL